MRVFTTIEGLDIWRVAFGQQGAGGIHLGIWARARRELGERRQYRETSVAATGRTGRARSLLPAARTGGGGETKERAAQKRRGRGGLMP